MKKVFLVMIVVLIAIGINAQEKASKGMWLGGTVGFTSGDYDGTDVSSYKIGPAWGMMLNKQWGAGVNLLIKGQDNSGESVNTWSVEPYIRYYKGITGNFKFFGDGVVAFGGGDNHSMFGVGVRPGMQYWFTSNWSMASSLGMLGYKSETHNKGEVNERDYSNFGLDFDMSAVNFSLFYHF